MRNDDIPVPGTAETDAEIADVKATQLAGLRAVVRVSELRGWTRAALPAVAARIHEAGVEPSGPPMSILRLRPDGAVEVSVGYPVPAPLPGNELVPETLPAGLVVRALHRGPHESLLCTYDRLVEWLVGHHCPTGSLMWEQYEVGPQTTGEEARWRTAVVCPLRR